MPYFTLKAIEGRDDLYRVFHRKSAESAETPGDRYIKKSADTYYLAVDIADDVYGTELLLVGTLASDANASITMLADRFNSKYYHSDRSIPYTPEGPSFTLKAIEGRDDLYQLFNKASTESAETPNIKYIQKKAGFYYLVADLHGPQLSVLSPLSADANECITMLKDRYDSTYYSSSSFGSIANEDAILDDEQNTYCDSQARALSQSSVLFASIDSGSGSSHSVSHDAVRPTSPK